MKTANYCNLFGEHKSYPCPCGYGHWKFVEYIHHGEKRMVREDLKGLNADFCLCHSCAKFKPNSTDNCEIASGLHAFIIRNHALAIIWDCAEFAPNF